MNFPPRLSDQQWSDLAQMLHDTCGRLPATGSYEPYYDASSWDLDDIYRDFLAEARGSRLEVSLLVEEFESRGAWPRGRYKGKFWLRARLEEADAFVREIVARASGSAIQCDDSLAKDARTAREWLVYTHFDQRLAEYWLMDHIEFYVHLPNPLDAEHSEYFHSWISKVKAGHYLKK